MVRGAPSNDNRIMNHPQYLVGFGYLRNVAIDQHVVARERLPDLHDSLTSRRPDLLGISEDEGTAWVVQGDRAEIIGRNKAFVYNGRDANDPGVRSSRCALATATTWPPGASCRAPSTARR
jgi:cyanophycinase-like exopeptidase